MARTLDSDLGVKSPKALLASRLAGVAEEDAEEDVLLAPWGLDLPSMRKVSFKWS